jgi:hypothetical protein
MDYIGNKKFMDGAPKFKNYSNFPGAVQVRDKDNIKESPNDEMDGTPRTIGTTGMDGTESGTSKPLAASPQAQDKSKRIFPMIKRFEKKGDQIDLPKQGMSLKNYVEENPTKPSVTQMLSELLEEKKHSEMKKDTDKRSKPWKWPWKWKANAKQASKKKELVLVFYFTIKGELDTFIVPIYGGNMVIIKNKVYEFDPRAVWTSKIGMKWYKLLAIKEIDRRPISNLDLDEVRRRGDSTDSDEFLIKAALKAQIQTVGAKAMGKGVIILAVLALVGILVFFFLSKK